MARHIPEGIDESELALAIGGQQYFASPTLEREYKFREVLRIVLPYLGTSEAKIVLAQIMIALKLEGVIGKTLSGNESKMVKTIHDSIMVQPDKKKEAIRYAQRLLRTGEG